MQTPKNDTRPDRCAADPLHRRPQGRRSRRWRARSTTWSRTAAPRWWSPPASRRRNTPISASPQRKDLIRRTIELVDEPRAGDGRHLASPRSRPRSSSPTTPNGWGAAAVQLLAPLRPFAGPPTQADLIAYFEAIGRETKLPITLYLNPGPGADVSIPDTIALAKLPQVQLIKESSRDLARVSRLIVEIDRAGHARYFTTMQMLLATLAARRLRRNHAAAGLRDRARRHRRLRRQGLRARGGNPASVRAVSVEVDASRPRARHEGRDEPDRHCRPASPTRPTRRCPATR